MPTLANTSIPIPTSWNEFEEITLDALKIKWDSPNLQRHGRTGQAQAGVDIYGEDHLDFQVGVQCKKYEVELSIKVIEQEILNAEKFTPPIEIFFIATTQPTDAKLQKAVRIISKKRKDAQQFPVAIFFWSDIVQELVTNERIFKKHFPQFNIGDTSKASKRLFSILDIGFHGLNIRHYSDVLYGVYGRMANEDPRKIEVVFSLIESACLVTCSEQEQKRIKTVLLEYLDYVIPVVTGSKKNPDFYWKVANDIADRIAGQIRSVEHSLKGKELIVYRIGELLGYWNRYEFEKEDPIEPIEEDFLLKLQKFIEQLNDGKLPDEILILFKKYRSEDDWIQTSIADKFYNKLRQALLEAEIFSK